MLKMLSCVTSTLQGVSLEVVLILHILQNLNILFYFLEAKKYSKIAAVWNIVATCRVPHHYFTEMIYLHSRFQIVDFIAQHILLFHRDTPRWWATCSLKAKLMNDKHMCSWNDSCDARIKALLEN